MSACVFVGARKINEFKEFVQYTVATYMLQQPSDSKPEGIFLYK